MKLRFDHIGILVKNLEEAINFYSKYLGWERPKKGPYAKMLDSDERRITFLSINGNFVELLEPKQGTWLEFMKEKGEGTIFELCLVVDDIEELYAEMKKKGITPVGRFNSPLVEKKYVECPGFKFLYLPRQKTHGTLIEFVERVPGTI